MYILIYIYIYIYIICLQRGTWQENIVAVADVGEACHDADVLIFCLPHQVAAPHTLGHERERESHTHTLSLTHTAIHTQKAIKQRHERRLTLTGVKGIVTNRLRSV